MNPVLPTESDYDALPESIKAIYTKHEYDWMSDDRKARIVESETEPETD